MSKLWFKNKSYGWGWTPCSKEGWAVTIIFVLLIISIAINYAEKNIALFFTYLILSIAALITITYIKGEKPRWQWGKR